MIPCLLRQRPRQYYPLTFAPRQPVQLAALELSGICAGHGIVGNPAVLPSFQLEPSQVGVAAHQHRFQRGEGVQGVVLRHESDATSSLSCVQALKRIPSKLHGAGVRANQPGERPQQRALARAVRPDQARDFPGTGLEGHRLQYEISAQGDC